MGTASALNASNTPTCSVNGAADGNVVTFSDGTYQRCMAVITPSSSPKPMPILWWFHGAGGNAAHCGNMRDMLSLAESTGPSPSPSGPPAACQKCFLDGCPNLHKAGSAACQTCVESHQGSCAGSCAPYPFKQAISWFCDASELQLV